MLRSTASAAAYSCKFVDAPVEANTTYYNRDDCNNLTYNYGTSRLSDGQYAACYYSRYVVTYNYTNDGPALRPGYNSCSGSDRNCGVYAYQNSTCKVESGPEGYFCNIDTHGVGWEDHYASKCIQGSSSCFPAGTKITMADKSQKNIEDVKAGDKVLGYDGKKQVSETVKELESPVRDHLYTLSFSDKTTLSLTREHPLYTPAGWKSISPQDTSKENASLKVQQLKVGDSVLNDKGKYIKIVSMTFKPGDVQTYNLKSVTGNNDFYAGGKLAHNKGSTNPPPAGCNCSAWTYHVCGGGSCPSNTKNETRTCDNNCSYESKCSEVVDACKAASCESAKSFCNSYNRCHKWDINGCSYDCGKCSKQGYSCDPNPKSNTTAGGNCKIDNSCSPKNCTNIGAVPPGQANGQEGQKCKKQFNECGGVINNPACGNCGPGLHCAGADSNGVGGTCKKDPQPPNYDVRVIVFYDGNAKAKKASYTSCYPASDALNNGASSGNVNITVNSGESGIATKTYSKVSYKNCKTGGKSSSSDLGFVIQRTDKKKSIKFNNPNPNLYELTGYSYSLNGSSSQTVCALGSTAAGCNGSFSKTPMLSGDVVVRFGYRKTATPQPKKLNAFVFEDPAGLGRYDNGGSCFESGTTDPVKINGTDFYERSGANANVDDCKFFRLDNNTNNTVTLSQIGLTNGTLQDYVATGYEYVDDRSGPDHNDNCYGTDHVPVESNPQDPTGKAWGCVHNSGDNDTTESVNLTGNAEVHFGVKLAPTFYSVSGSIFIDEPPLTVQGTDAGYHTAEPKTIFAYFTKATDTHDAGDFAGSDVVDNQGNYKIDNLVAGEYTIQYNNFPPTGYQKTYPRNGTTPPSFDVFVGTGKCWIEKSTPTRQTSLKEASCANGSIIGLNFGITNIADPWFQAVGGDMWIDGDLTDPVPANLFASIGQAGPPAYDPGLVITDQASASLGTGTARTKANSPGWLSLGNAYNPLTDGTRASYEYIKSALDAGGQSPTGMYPPGGPCAGQTAPNCIFPTGAANFPGDTWIASQDLDISNTGTDYTFPANQNYIILVHGNLTIRRNLIVPTSSTVIFAASGNITIGTAVTEIDGIYSTDGKFITSPAATQLLVKGTVIANADLGITANSIDDVFDNSRDLNGTNATTPSVKFIMRPDFMIHLPPTIRIPNYVIQEVAPGPGYQFGTP